MRNALAAAGLSVLLASPAGAIDDLGAIFSGATVYRSSGIAGDGWEMLVHR